MSKTIIIIMKHLRYIVIWLMLIPLHGLCKGEDDDFHRHRFGMSGALTSSDTWQLDFTYHYMLTRNIGVGGALGTWEQWYIDGMPSGDNWWIDSDDEHIGNIYLRPSLLLVSPRLFSAGLWIFALMAEPGVMMNVPYQRVCIEMSENHHITDYKYVSTSRGQWCAFECRAGIEANFMYGNITLGYMFSTLDIYGIRRNLHFDGVSFGDFYPRRRLMHGAFLSVTIGL